LKDPELEPDLDPYLVLMDLDQDPGVPKTWGFFEQEQSGV
jgi:hypothetical protein